MTTQARHARWFLAFLVTLFATVVGLLSAAPASGAPAAYTCDPPAYTYDAPVRLSTSHPSDGPARASPACPGVASWVSHASVGWFGVAAEAGAGAENVVNGVRLRAQLTGEEIAGGHAFDKHVVELGEFPGVANRSQFAGVIEDVVTNGEMRTLSGGRTGYWQNGTVVIRNPGAVDGGTAFRPKTGYDYFVNTLH
jgi:hypothetical protein